MRVQGRGGEFFIDNLLARIHFIIVMIRWTGLTPWEFEFPFPGSLTSTFLVCKDDSLMDSGSEVDDLASHTGPPPLYAPYS